MNIMTLYKFLLGIPPPYYDTVKKWTVEIKWGRDSTEDDLRPGRPKTSIAYEQINNIYFIVLDGRRLTAQ